MSNDDDDDDDDDKELQTQVESLVRELASSRPDCYVPAKRRALIAQVSDWLRDEPLARLDLSQLQDIRCSSQHAFRRVIPFYTLSLLQAEPKDTAETRNLLQTLIRLLEEANEPCLVETCRKELTTSLSNEQQTIFAKLLWETTSTSVVAVGLGSSLDSSSTSKSLFDWLGRLLQISLTQFSTNLDLIQVFLKEQTTDDWNNTIRPALLLKVKSHPDKSLETILSWIQHLTVATLDDEWTELLIQKHLLGVKEENRNVASRIIVAWASQSVAALEMLARVLATTSITLVPARIAVYETLQQLAQLGGAIEGVTDETVQVVLEGLVGRLSKETKPEHRKTGHEALIEWLVIGKRRKLGINGGFEKALESIRSSVVSQTVDRVGPLFGLLVVRVHPDMLESIVADLYLDIKFKQGLEGLIQQAASKKAVHVEGLLAVYMSLLHAVHTKTELSNAVTEVVSAGGSSKSGKSFMFSDNMMELVAQNPVVSLTLARSLALYMQVNSSTTARRLFNKDESAASRALAACISHPASVLDKKDLYASNAILACVNTVLSYQPDAAEGLVQALFNHVNTSAIKVEGLVKSLNATRDAREIEKELSVKGQGSVNAAHFGCDSNSIRCVACVLSKYCNKDYSVTAKSLVLMHVGSSLRNEGQQRTKLMLHTLRIVQDVLLSIKGKIHISGLADDIVLLVTNQMGSVDGVNEESCLVSYFVHKAALSLLTTLGGMASNYSRENDDPNDEDMKPYVFCSTLCLDEIGAQLNKQLLGLCDTIEKYSETDVLVYQGPVGILVLEEEQRSGAIKPSSRRLTEDEEWDMKTERELAKKSAVNVGSKTYSDDEKKQLAVQEARRAEMTGVIELHCMRVLDAIRFLCMSDIQIGNTLLPLLRDSVLALATSNCPAANSVDRLRSQRFETLVTLAACVYEIDEIHSPTLAQALLISCRRDEAGTKVLVDGCRLSVAALPSPCAHAACALNEIDDVHDALSGSSFAFLFPVISAALMGPRTPPGCEAALRVLERHTHLLWGEGKDPVVISLRREMVISVLELLKHDRAQTFHDPTALYTLVQCYNIDAEVSDGSSVSTADLAPILDERGALGTANSRIGAMMVLEHVASRNQSVLKKDPLVENRVWLNCFAKDEQVRICGRKAWLALQGADSTESIDGLSALPSPSLLYAAPLLPLLSNSDDSIVQAASMALASGMAKHSGSVLRCTEMLCKAYIESFPTSASDDNASASLTKPLSVKPSSGAGQTKKAAFPLSSGLTKKAPSSKSALAVAGIGRPKVAKKTQVSSALLKPRQERVLDQDELEEQFKASAKIKGEEKDTPAKTAVRLGVLRTISAITQLPEKMVMDVSALKLLTSFLMAYGLADSNEVAQSAARNALRDVVALYGDTDDAIHFLLPQLESVLKSGAIDEGLLGVLSKEKVPRDLSSSDRRKQGAVVALGSVALHLKGPDNESKVHNTVDMLLETLKTPSEEVQISVADALTKLMKKGGTQDRIESIVARLLNSCLSGENMASQRGSAYGIAAVVKGSGIGTLKKYDVVKQLEDACASGSSTSKEGALFAIELLSGRLGLLFEPYVIALLPWLLKSFSDTSDHVRTAAAHTVEIIMSQLSAHGVKLVMPAVLTAFNDASWRTKQASIQMLGAMSHLAPKQLASALPKVVPKLTEAFSDTHPKVKVSAQEALDEICTVIKNPEVSSISSALMKALTDPADYTIRALETLIETEFLHAIDAPSLALIAPILHRGLRDRGATTKRFGGLITGNITTMINDPKDLLPYLPVLLPDLQACLLDPIPDVRSTSAKALGSLTRSLGDEILPELRPWLLAKLREQSCSSAERSGAAQGLTEVLVASGTDIVEEAMLQEILPLQGYPEAATREGVLWVLSFLPLAMGQGYTSLLDQSLPALIAGLSDDSEPVRDVAMRAGRVLIRTHGKHHVDKILPSLEAGLANDDYRIRVASLSLLGDLLSMIGNTTLVKGDGDTQDDMRRAERAQAQIALVLGVETRRRVLSGLYLVRNDSIHVVRQNALQVWKTVVSVTGRTLREILPDLVSRIINDLASGEEEKTLVAGRCLGDVVSKLGESVLPQIVPVLRNALYDGNEHTRRGVCVGLTEVIRGSTKDQILKFLEIIVKVVTKALCDDDESVRRMAASSFKSLHAVVGSRTLDEVVPPLMVALENDDTQARVQALNGLTSILSVRSRELLPYILPRLVARPISLEHARALSSIAVVTGGSLYYHFSTVLPAILKDLSEIDDEDDPRYTALRECFRSICASVSEEGVNLLISEVASKCGNDRAQMRRQCCLMFETVITGRSEKHDFYEQIPIIIRELVYRLNDDDSSVLQATNFAFSALSKHVQSEELVKHVAFMKNLIASMVSDARFRKGGVGGGGEFFLPGFNIPKGLEPFLPIFQRGILYGSPEIREVSAAGLGEVIALTSSTYLDGPLIIKMTGPLLRIVGDRNPANVKVAILRTLGLILTKGGPALRAFVPQFQTTFVKALSDPSRQVRLAAIKALALLMPLTTRVDPLIKELVTGALGSSLQVEGVAAASIQHATLEALAVVVSTCGTKVKLPASITSTLDASKELLSHPDTGVREAAAKVLGETCALLPLDVIIDTVQKVIVDTTDDSSSEARHGKMCATRRILQSSVGTQVMATIPELKDRVYECLKDDKIAVREAAVVALGALIGRYNNNDHRKAFAPHERELASCLDAKQESLEVQSAAARGLCVALSMIDGTKRVDSMGLQLIDMSLKLALGGAQRVQFAFNEVLWLALDVQNGEEGLNRYCNIAVFDNIRSMKSLYTKILSKMTEASALND